MAKRKGGLPSKFMKMGGSLKSRWRAYKASLKGRKRTSATSKKSTTRTVTVRRPATMAKRLPAKRPRSRPKFSTSKMGNVLTNGATIVAPMLVSTAVVNTLPKVKNWKPWQKSTSQGILGLLLIFGFKNPWVKKMGFGTFAGGLFNLALPKLPNAFKMGKSRDLTQSELAALTMNNMGRPFHVQRTSMGKPYEMAKPYDMGGGNNQNSLGRIGNRSGRF